ncbi:MAG: DUF726 domain-containing protein [Deltaproteobacteria bacterium]|nr:DUF726 domain-containing protein [Deltaproteobacteria bacterium]
MKLLWEILKPLIGLRADALSALLRDPATLIKTTTQVKGAWEAAAAEADRSARRLLDELRATRAAHPRAPIYLIGHSLGGRMALRACALMAEEGAPVPNLHVSAWASALDTREVPWEALARLPSPPEVVHSAHDLVLKVIFRLATASLTGMPMIDMITLTAALAKGPDAAGLVGPPAGRYPAELGLDLSARAIGHLAYISEMPTVFQQSARLRPLAG